MSNIILDILKLSTCPTCKDVFPEALVQTDAILDGNPVKICEMCANEFATADYSSTLPPLDE